MIARVETPAGISINLNCQCTVTLLQPGVDAIRQHFAELDMEHLLPQRFPELYAGMQITEPLWQIMQYFGNRLFNGCDLPIETMVTINPDL